MITKFKKECKENSERFDHYLALDWASKNMALARMPRQGSKVHVSDKVSNLSSLKQYLSGLKGKKILTIEETTSTHWLYVELKDFVDKILICDPYRNGLLKDGPKNDKLDAKALCTLLRSGLLKEVFHSTDEAYDIRKLISAYDDFVSASTRSKNQKSAVYRSVGRNHKKENLASDCEIMNFIDSKYDKSINMLSEIKKEFKENFEEIRKKNKTIRQLMTVSGIGIVWALRIYSTVVDASRFENKYKYWSYCGLTYHLKESGGRSYGKKKSRHSRSLRGVYLSAARSAINGNNDINHYYEALLRNGVESGNAFNQIARHIAKSTLAIMKHKESYKPYKWREVA